MRFIYLGALAMAVGCSVISSAVLCQSVELPKDVMDKLQHQPQAQARKITVVPSSPASSRSVGAGLASQNTLNADGMRRLRQLLDQVETNRGAQSGTLKAISSRTRGISLQHDLPKVRQTFTTLTDAPFGEALSEVAPDTKAAKATTPAAVEYKAQNSHDSVENIISIKSKGAVAANAFASGAKPVSLKVNNANLSATQIPGSDAQLPVNVEVGNESRQMKVGDVSRFGNVDVTILASSNRSNKVGYEGLPYSLRLQVMPVQ